jgi:hypothetical protein
LGKKIEKQFEETTGKELAELVGIFKEANELINNKAVNFDMREFAKGYAQGYGAYTPDMTNTAMKNINLNPLTATVDKINSALESAKNNESNLIAYGQDMYLKNMLYKRNFDYINSLPAWNLSITCPGITASECKSKEYTKDYKKIRDFFAKFNYRAEFDK